MGRCGAMIDLCQGLFYLSEALAQIKEFKVLFVEVNFLFKLEHIRQEKSIHQLEGYANILRNSNQVMQLWNKLVNNGSKYKKTLILTHIGVLPNSSDFKNDSDQNEETAESLSFLS